ncbi:helix-turn-helix domain-containing protein [Actinomycetaceae bacterium TAE3-ERU4]|nr:helix-turn-helix domain-containing protein [Actinomycetaceae bacterium TAE3-ERU4]
MARRRLTSAERELLDAIADRIASFPPSEINPKAAKEAARITVAALRTTESLDDLVGPTCTTSEIAAWWGVSRQAIHKAIAQGRIVAVQDPRRTWHFPTWQLREDHASIEGISRCIEVLQNVPQAAVASWFIRPNAFLDDLTPAKWLIESREISLAVMAARKYAAAYARSLRARS